jgi:membrane protein implicated in regulation of membrane protease activity
LPGDYWLVVGLVFLGLEMTRGDFYLFGAGLGALAAGVATVLLHGLGLGFLGFIQWPLFVAVGLGSAVSIRPVLTSWLKDRPGRHLPDPMERLTGQQGEVVEVIVPSRAGTIILNGKRWLASALDESEIPVGAMVEVFGIEGTTLTVLPVLEHQDPSGGRKGVS